MRNQYGSRSRALPRSRTTKPVCSPSSAPAEAETCTETLPGTPTDEGAVTAAPRPGVCSSIETDHSPAPPPASARSIVSVMSRGPPATSTNPKPRLCGEAKTSGAMAAGRSISPPPWRVLGTPRSRPLRTSADFTCSGVHSGCSSSSSAAAPATCGVAMLVPERRSKAPSGAAERTSTPGAARSGLRASPSGVGPPAEKEAMSRSSDAATVIARAAVPGEPTEPPPSSRKSLPAATTETTPAAAALSSARATASRSGSTSGSPSERLITSIPSTTAASIAATISGELPFRPNPPSVGVVSTL